MRDDKIIALLRRKSERGLRALADQYGRLLIYIASGILRNRPEDAEECVNDAYMHIWSHAETFDFSKASLPTYLKVLVRNASLNRLKQIRRSEGAAALEEAENIEDAGQDVERRVIGREEIRRLESLMETLGETDRQLLIRRYFYLQSSREIAQLMSMTVTAVDSRMSRLRSKIRNYFEEDKRNE